MSHYHVELILPPTPRFEIRERVLEILLPLRKGDDEATWPADPLFDWYKIGGRFAGTKHGLRCDPERRRKFYEELYSDEFTSDDDLSKLGFWGDDQLPAVNALWRKWFPEDEVGICPFIGPYPTRDQDICRVDRISDELKADTVVVGNEANQVVLRLKTEIWDSIKRKFIDTGFDGSVLDALRRCRAAGVEPAGDWLAVTLDCHI